eukprot:13462348-Alexandrium_andersonii.AAC.1
MQQRWKVAVWSLKFAFSGVWPSHDVAGNSYASYPDWSFEKQMMNEPLAPGYFPTLWSCTGDLDYFAKL